MNLDLDKLHQYCTECGGCLLWNQSVNSAGYPNARIKGKNVNLRRFIFETKLGKQLGPAMCVTSICNDKRCVAPDHLRRSNRSQLMYKSYAARQRNEAVIQRKVIESRIKSGLTKLDYEKAREIRSSELTDYQLAEKYGVGVKTVQRILQNKSWVEGNIGASVFTWRP